MRMKFTAESLLALITACCLLAATNPAIGLAMAKGSFRVDNSPVWGNSSLWEGATLESEQTSIELRLSNGAHLGLGPGSRGQVYRDRLVLERGLGELKAGADYLLEARTLRIVPLSKEAVARVGFDDQNQVLVAAVNGPVRVTRGNLVLANLDAGRTLAFALPAQQPGAAPPVKITGRLERRDGHFLLTDEVSKAIFEIVGADLDKEVGNRVEISGVIDPAAKPFPPATQVVKVSKMSRLGAAPVPAGAGAAGWAGLSTAAKVAIIGGVVVGATVGILAATDVIFKEKKPVSP